MYFLLAWTAAGYSTPGEIIPTGSGIIFGYFKEITVIHSGSLYHNFKYHRSVSAGDICKLAGKLGYLPQADLISGDGPVEWRFQSVV